MALNFPASPTVNQVFTAAGTSWVWDGVKWMASSGTTTLLRANNLSDVASVPTSRTNLGLGTMATQNANAVAVVGGTIDNTAIGGTTRAAGAFTSVYGAGYAAQGPTGIYYAYDRGNSGGTTSAAFQFYRDGNTGRLTMSDSGGGLSIDTSGNGSFTGTLAAGNVVTSSGANAGFQCQQRDGSTSAMLYRAGATGRLWCSDYGDAFSFSNAGNCIVATALSIGTTLTVNGSSISAPNLTTWGAQFGAPGGYPLYVHSPNGTNTYMNFTMDGVRGWYLGPGSDQIFRILDATANHTHFNANPGNNQVTLGGGTTITGDYGAWGAAMLRSSTVNGYVPDGIGSTTQVSGYSAFNADVQNANSYLIFFTKNGRAAAVGSITTDGNVTYYNASSDGRLKKNLRPLAKEIDVGRMIDAIEPVAFEWTSEPDEPTGHGFVAQSLQKIVPLAVRKGSADDPVLHPWGVDFSKLVPYMVAEMQQMRKRIAQLEAGHA
jgi:Chaperone of endosialidase